MSPHETRAGTLVLGIGNLLMGDEGVGIHVVRALRDEDLGDDVDLVDGGTGGFHLLEYFERYRRVILIDAAVDGTAPGTVRRVRPRYADDYPPGLTAHDIGLKSMLDAARLMGHEPEVELVTISVAQPGDVELKLSDPVRAAIPEAVHCVRRCLKPTAG